jgi:hypothetical protein
VDAPAGGAASAPHAAPPNNINAAATVSRLPFADEQKATLSKLLAAVTSANSSLSRSRGWTNLDRANGHSAHEASALRDAILPRTLYIPPNIARFWLRAGL